MPIQFQCPQCLSVKSAPDEQGGKLGKCKCGVYLRIPAAGSGQKVAVVEAPPTTPSNPIRPFAQAPQTTPKQAEYDEDTRILQSYYRADTKAREKKHEPTLYAGLADWDATLTGIIVGVMLFGPCMLWYGWAIQDFGFLMLGFIASAFWFGLIFVALFFRLDWIDILSLCFERLGFSDLDSSDGLIRAAYILGTGATTILLLFGISWCYLFFSGGNEAIPKNSPIARREAQPSDPDAEKVPQPAPKTAAELEQEQWDILKTEFVNSLNAVKKPDSSEAETPRSTIESNQPQENWQPCVDRRTIRYTDEYLRRFGQLAELPTASPSLRFILHDEVLYDLETKSFSQFKGRPYRLASPIEPNTQKPIDISEDGKYQLTYLRYSNLNPTHKVCLQKVDNSLLQLYPDCREAYFLPGDSILLESETAAPKIVSVSDQSTKEEFGDQKFLGLSINRKYIAFGKELPQYTAIPTAWPERSIRGKALELTIYDAATIKKVASVTLPALASIGRAIFSQDGEKLLLVGDDFCTAVSLVDGSLHNLIAKFNRIEHIGWLGNDSQFVYMQSSGSSDQPSLISIHDAELGSELFEITTDRNSLFDSFDGSYVRTDRNPENWYRMPMAELEKAAIANSELAKKKPITKAKLQFEMDWKYSNKVKELMRDVVSKQFGLELVDDKDVPTNSDECITLRIVISQRGVDEIEVHVWAQTENAQTFWFATDYSRDSVNLRDESFEVGVKRAEVLKGIAKCFNLIAAKTPFSTRDATAGNINLPKIELKDCEAFALTDPTQDFAPAEPRIVDNSWFTQRDDLELTRLPLLDCSLPTDPTPSNSTSWEAIGFINEKDGPALILNHSAFGVFSLELKANSVPTKLEGMDEFSQIKTIPATNELLVVKEKQLLLQSYDAKKKRPLILNLDSEPLHLAVSANGKTLAVAHESTVDFYDLEKFRSKPRDPKAKIFEAQYKLGDGKMALSPNGLWFSGYEKSSKENGIVLRLDSGEEQRFFAYANANHLIVDDDGEYNFFDESANLKKYFPPTEKERGGTSDRIISQLNGLVSGALSLEGKQVVLGDRYGNVEIRSYPSMNPAENLWDPGFIPKIGIQGTMGWSPEGNYFYWLQGDRVLVWEAPPQVEGDILK